MSTQNLSEQNGPVRVKYLPEEFSYQITYDYQEVANVPLAHLNFLGHDLFGKNDKERIDFGLKTLKPAFGEAYEGIDLAALKKQSVNRQAVIEKDVHGVEKAAIRENFFAAVYYQNELSVRNHAALHSIQVTPARQASNVHELDLRRA